jgi:hypothetical protein
MMSAGNVRLVMQRNYQFCCLSDEVSKAETALIIFEQ